MIFEMWSWVISKGKIEEHDELVKKMISCIQKFEELKSYRYYSHWGGQGQSPLGGRLEILEFENLTTMEKFHSKLYLDEEHEELFQKWYSLVEPSTARRSLLFASQKNKELWFEK